MLATQRHQYDEELNDSRSDLFRHFQESWRQRAKQLPRREGGPGGVE
jgi:hypothetical protein